MKENTFSFIFFLQNLIVLLRLVPFSTFSTVNHLPACTFSGRTCFWLKLKMLHIEWRGKICFPKVIDCTGMILLFVPPLANHSSRLLHSVSCVLAVQSLRSQAHNQKILLSFCHSSPPLRMNFPPLLSTQFSSFSLRLCPHLALNLHP